MQIGEKDDWIDKDVIIFLKGRINGLILKQNEVKRITVTEGTTYKRYPGKSRSLPKLNIVESSNGAGFNGLEGCLAAIQEGQKIKGIVLKENEIFGIICGKEEF